MSREREPDELRVVRIERGYTAMTPGSVLIQMGDTIVLCTASVAKDVPRWMRGTGKGWVTAEYGMLPGSSQERIGRERSRESGRTKEIERLIGRSLRAVTNLEAFGEFVVTVDCDVLQADGGTRTAAITGGFVALYDAFSTMVANGLIPKHPIVQFLAAISVGIVDGLPVLDLDYADDVRADVDMNVVMTESGQFVEVQGTAERNPFSRGELDDLLGLAAGGIEELIAAEKELLLE